MPESPSEWWSGGFPNLRATTKQRFYLQKRLHILMDILCLEELTALQLMGFDRWLVSVSKDRASVFIGQMKLREEKKKEERIAKSSVVQEKIKSIAIAEGICFACGGDLIKGTVSSRCSKCGKVSFHVCLT